MQVYVNGAPVSHRPFHSAELGQLPAPLPEGLYLVLECDPVQAGDDITSDAPAWVRFPMLNWKGDVILGNMRLDA